MAAPLEVALFAGFFALVCLIISPPFAAFVNGSSSMDILILLLIALIVFYVLGLIAIPGQSLVHLILLAIVAVAVIRWLQGNRRA